MSRELIGQDLDMLAISLLQSVSPAAAIGAATPVPLDTRIDVFKAVSTYHLACLKVKKPSDDPDTPGATFGALVNRIHKEGTA